MSVIQPPTAFLAQADSKASSRVGKDVLGFCSRCKMNLMHTIVTVTAANKPEKVQCNTCRSGRTFRAPKSDSELSKSKSTSDGGKKMSDRDDEFEIDPLDVGKALLGDEPKKKSKAKAKAKAKKPKEEGEAKFSKAVAATLPLSMLPASADDLAQFDARIAGQKNAVANAKDYKASVRFGAGEVINHPTFGTGFILAENGLSKIEVLFKVGRKLLVTAPKS